MLNLIHIILALLASSAAASAIPEAEARKGGSKTVRITEGQSIQQALSSATRGDRIEVEAGTYYEQLTIKTNGITLVGKGAKLVPPENPVQNECSGIAGPLPDGSPTQAGICVAGADIAFGDFIPLHSRVTSVGRPVKDVSVFGFTVSNFTGFNILVMGAENANVYKNKLLDGPTYGLLTLGSKNTKVSDNEVTSTLPGFIFIGICMDNLSKVKVTRNKISAYYIGLCIQTNGAEVEDNQVSDACYGAFIDPGVKSARVRNNRITKSFAECAPGGAAGILLDGSIGARVEDNFVSGWKSDDPRTAGIAIVDDLTLPSGPAIARNNFVTGNKLRDNLLDIFMDTKGNGNVVKRNDCSTSDPAGLCRAN